MIRELGFKKGNKFYVFNRWMKYTKCTEGIHMRIVFVGPGFRFKHRYFYYSFYKMLLAGFYRTNHLISFMSDRDTADSFLAGWRAIGIPYARRELLAACRELKADLLILCHADIIDIATLDTIKSRCGTQICMVDCDYLDVSADKSSVRRLKHLSSVIDAAFFTTGGRRLRRARDIFENSYFIPNPLDQGAFSNFARRDRPFDVGYVSSGRGYRSEILSRLSEAGLDVQIRGGKKERALYGAAFEEFICSAKSGLIASLYDEDLYSSDRIAQVFGAGCMALIPRSIGFQQFIREDQALFFDDQDELLLRLGPLLASGEWFDVGQRGREAYFKQFNSRRVAEYIIARTLNPADVHVSFEGSY